MSCDPGTLKKYNADFQDKVKALIDNGQFGSKAERKTVIEHLREAEKDGRLPMGYLIHNRRFAKYDSAKLSAVVDLATGNWSCQGAYFSGGVRAFINWWGNRVKESGKQAKA